MRPCTNLQSIAVGLSLYGDAVHVFNHTEWANITDMIHSLPVVTSRTLRLVTLTVEYEKWDDNPMRNILLFRDGKDAMRRLDTALCDLVDERSRQSHLHGGGKGHMNFTLVIRREDHLRGRISDEAKKSFEEAFLGLRERGALRVV